jgi:magnesium chelatase family protein
VSGALALAEALHLSEGIDTIVVPKENAEEVSLLRSSKIRIAQNLLEIKLWLERGDTLAKGMPFVSPSLPEAEEPLLDGVRGQALAKRALQIALAGRHHLLLVGPPGVGKSMLASTTPALLPPLEESELIELVKNRSQFNLGDPTFWKRPFRSPHHTISPAALLGGGSGMIVQGEVTLCHAGVLFLDEFPEFRKDALEGLREPLQSGVIHLNRIGSAISLPAKFLLIAAMNPCPCGYSLDWRKRCTCPPGKAEQYRKRISGPIYDRLDLCVMLSSFKAADPHEGLSHLEVATSVARTYTIQKKRHGGVLRFNAESDVVSPSGDFALCGEVKDWIETVCEREGLSFRSFHKTVRVARTIADLEGALEIGLPHVREAWSLRCRDLSTVH